MDTRIVIRHPRKREFFSKLALRGQTAQSVLSEAINQYLKEDKMHKGYVITNRNQILVQVPDTESRYGFYLADDDQTFDGGLGVAESWEAIPENDPRISREVKDRLGWMLES